MEGALTFEQAQATLKLQGNALKSFKASTKKGGSGKSAAQAGESGQNTLDDLTRVDARIRDKVNLVTQQEDRLNRIHGELADCMNRREELLSDISKLRAQSKDLLAKKSKEDDAVSQNLDPPSTIVCSRLEPEFRN